MSRYEPHPVTAAASPPRRRPASLQRRLQRHELDGVGFCQLTIRDGRRHSVADAFLGPCSTPQLDAAHRRARAVAWSSRARAASASSSRAEARSSCARARHEVVVCAGTIESPRLLLLSGIGPADRNRRLGIEPLVDLRGVGQNLHDHLLSPVIFTAKQTVPPPLPGLQPLHAHLFARTRGSLDRPTSSRCSSTCRCTPRARRARRTASR